MVVPPAIRGLVLLQRTADVIFAVKNGPAIAELNSLPNAGLRRGSRREPLCDSGLS